MNNVLIPSSLLLIVLLIIVVFGIAAVILALNISLGLTLLLVFILSSMVIKITLDLPPLSPSSWLSSVSLSSSFSPHIVDLFAS